MFHVQVEITVIAQTPQDARHRTARWLEGGPGQGWIQVRVIEDWDG